MLKIRLFRMGRRNDPKYRVVLVDARQKRQGAYIENLGHYDPAGETKDKVSLKIERCKHWMELGAQPTESVQSLLNLQGLKVTEVIKPKISRRKAQRDKKKAAKA